MHRYLRVFALAAAALLALPPAPVAADGTASGWTDGAGVGARAETGQDPPASSPRRSSPKPRCTYDEMTPKEAENTDHMAKNGLGPERGEGPGRWLWKTCVEPDGNAWGTVAWIPQRTDPDTVARRALQYTALPGPASSAGQPGGAFVVTATVEWRITWTALGAAGRRRPRRRPALRLPAAAGGRDPVPEPSPR
jgi:hypothetical protein